MDTAHLITNILLLALYVGLLYFTIVVGFGGYFITQEIAFDAERFIKKKVTNILLLRLCCVALILLHHSVSLFFALVMICIFRNLEIPLWDNVVITAIGFYLGAAMYELYYIIKLKGVDEWLLDPDIGDGRK